MHRRIWGPHRSAQARPARDPLSSPEPWPPLASSPRLPSSCPSLLSPRSRAPAFVIVRALAARWGRGAAGTGACPWAPRRERAGRGGARHPRPSRRAPQPGLAPGTGSAPGAARRAGRGQGGRARGAAGDRGGASGGGRSAGRRARGGSRRPPGSLQSGLISLGTASAPPVGGSGSRSSPTGELLWGAAEVAGQAGAPGAGCGRALPARPAPPPPSRFAGSRAGLPMTGGSPASSVA